jgi:hypothetical protein
VIADKSGAAPDLRWVAAGLRSCADTHAHAGSTQRALKYFLAVPKNFPRRLELQSFKAPPE